MSLWQKFKCYLRDRVPEHLLGILEEAGYDNIFSLKLLNKEAVDELQKFTSELLPGHRTVLMAFPSMVSEFEQHLKQIDVNEIHAQYSKNSIYTYILSTLIKTAQQNANKGPHQCRYSEELQYFAIYLYILCGKMSYEVLCNNLPLPKVPTIRKF